ncbi:Alpha/Beta hydrolase protein [Staphylotrichum tortipilum]|uniref:Alpha/Beta hydrolase protein n=1 Tax=Staphylotrichum tortipilum TaxID=2831512 RepID=A0AAN6RQG9_9PEZI|nr:Alpha/Beta hydrolase protein [Staphylotrichum longicolle]
MAPPDPPGFFPPATTIPPLSSPHETTLILLHGRGLSAHTFGPDLLATAFRPPSSSPSTSPNPPSTTTLPTHLPHTKFLLPLAPRHRATIYKRSIIHQWFDSWHLESCAPGTEEWRVVDGLRDTVAHVHALVRAEAALVGGSGNVVLAGLSQGCAAAVVAGLLWDGEERLGAVVGMCGWLVFEGGVRGVVGRGEGGGDGEDDPFERDKGDGEVAPFEKNEEDGGFDPFERDEEDDSGDKGEMTVEAQVVRLLREMLEMDGDVGDGSRPKSFDTPIFLGHGTEDDKVPIVRGREAAECLRATGVDVEWKEYPGLGHWYSPDMLTDITAFLQRRLGWGQDTPS